MDEAARLTIDIIKDIAKATFKCTEGADKKRVARLEKTLENIAPGIMLYEKVMYAHGESEGDIPDGFQDVLIKALTMQGKFATQVASFYNKASHIYLGESVNIEQIFGDRWLETTGGMLNKFHAQKPCMSFVFDKLTKTMISTYLSIEAGLDMIGPNRGFLELGQYVPENDLGKVNNESLHRDEKINDGSDTII